MATPSQKLALSLETLKKLQKKGDPLVIRSGQLSRTHRERLVSNGFLREVIKGWYIVSHPGEKHGDSTSWYASFWNFCSEYLQYRLSDEWILSPEQSLMFHAGKRTVPLQLFIKSPKANNNIVKLPFGTSIFDVKSTLPDQNMIVVLDGIRLYSLTEALISCSEKFFKQHPTDARTALLMIKDASDLLGTLLDGGHSVVAGRLTGAFRNIERNDIANEILATMKAAGFDVREKDPFTETFPHFVMEQQASPYVYRIRQMWQTMRVVVLKHFPSPPETKIMKSEYLKTVDEAYQSDAYNSLSIEGYQVTDELIERVRSGKWNPDTNKEDNESVNAMAARGYWLAFQSVKQSIGQVLSEENPGTVVKADHRTWYRELFAPSVTTGLLKPSDLAGYRNSQVYIRLSKHIPPNSEAVRDTMPVFFELLENEPEPAVRAILGHFVFVYIHPYTDGNGRIARFLMNVMFSSGSYPWTVIPVTRRVDYMEALEKASVENDIMPFTMFIASLILEKNE